jgi:hypothetical protein
VNGQSPKENILGCILENLIATRGLLQLGVRATKTQDIAELAHRGEIFCNGSHRRILMKNIQTAGGLSLKELVCTVASLKNPIC